MLYVVYSPEAKAMKIGISVNPRKRLHSLQTSFPYKLYMAGVIQDAGLAEEVEFHEALKEYRMSGEWFRMDVKCMNEVARMLGERGAMQGEEYLKPRKLANQVEPHYSDDPDHYAEMAEQYEHMWDDRGEKS